MRLRVRFRPLSRANLENIVELELKKITKRLVEHGNFKQHYVLISEALRSYAMAAESDWSTDLTTDELAPQLKSTRLKSRHQMQMR